MRVRCCWLVICTCEAGDDMDDRFLKIVDICKSVLLTLRNSV